jgi:molecular chaperone GrpE
MPTSPGNEEPPPGAREFAGDTEERGSAEPIEAAEVAAVREELARAKDHRLRALADLDNYRKRAAREVERRVEESRERLIADRLDAVGVRFDPQRHEAISVRPAPDAPDQTVLEVARSGFALADGTILRPAQVVVSRRPAG